MHGKLFFLVYFDDSIITVVNNVVVADFVDQLKGLFALKDLGSGSYFLGMEMNRDSHKLLLS